MIGMKLRAFQVHILDRNPHAHIAVVVVDVAAVHAGLLLVDADRYAVLIVFFDVRVTNVKNPDPWLAPEVLRQSVDHDAHLRRDPARFQAAGAAAHFLEMELIAERLRTMMTRHMVGLF